jgi:hypothetical protein
VKSVLDDLSGEILRFFLSAQGEVRKVGDKEFKEERGEDKALRDARTDDHGR